MAAPFYINPGELRTTVRIQNETIAGQGAHKTSTWIDIGNETADDSPRTTRARWVEEPGRLAYLSSALQTVAAAEMTVRYNDQIAEQSRVIKDGVTYQIIDADDPDQHHRWLVVTLKASVNG